MNSFLEGRIFRVLAFLGVVCASAGACFSLDREAFGFTHYDLNLRLEPEQHRLGVRGKIRLRNNSQAPQKIAVLQISSSLDWRSIRAGDQAVQFITEPLTSDIDHTGGLCEAIVTLPQPVPPAGTIDLDVGYEGVILSDATRLTRIGTPEEAAKGSDWDQIGADFTALRGAGYVAWYPIATEVANLSEGNSLFEVLGRWKAREAGSKMHLQVNLTPSKTELESNREPLPEILFSGVGCNRSHADTHDLDADCQYQVLGPDVPTLVVADYGVLERPGIAARFLRGHETAAANFADEAEKTAPFVSEWFGPQRERAQVAELPGADDSPFESGALLLTPLGNSNSKIVDLAAVHQLTHASFVSFRPWVEEGLAHFAQAVYLEQQKGRQAAIDYMTSHRSAIAQSEPATTPPKSEEEATRSLVNTTDEELYRSKAMCVWWMLRDMIGDATLKRALANYRSQDDNDPAYVQRRIAEQTQRDLGWFFDDWVYHDHGLPNFKVESAFARKALGNAYIVTVTVDDLGGAGAEVPITVKFAGGQITKRLEVRAKNKSVIRIETAATPEEIVVNDGSVPEMDISNNVYKIETVDIAPASEQ